MWFPSGDILPGLLFDWLFDCTFRDVYICWESQGWLSVLCCSLSAAVAEPGWVFSAEQRQLDLLTLRRVHRKLLLKQSVALMQRPGFAYFHLLCPSLLRHVAQFRKCESINSCCEFFSLSLSCLTRSLLRTRSLAHIFLQALSLARALACSFFPRTVSRLIACSLSLHVCRSRALYSLVLSVSFSFLCTLPSKLFGRVCACICSLHLPVCEQQTYSCAFVVSFFQYFRPPRRGSQRYRQGVSRHF